MRNSENVNECPVGLLRGKMAKVTRRTFIKIGSAAVGGAAVAGGLVSDWYGADAPRLHNPDTNGDKVIPTFCELCFWKCGVLAHVKDGRVTKLEGNPDHPLSRGRLCPRVQVEQGFCMILTG